MEKQLKALAKSIDDVNKFLENYEQYIYNDDDAMKFYMEMAQYRNELILELMKEI